MARWDIFCSVVDNYGDIGVTWRLARQLVAEHGQQVRLWVDEPRAFVPLCPGADPLAARQWQQDVEVCRWGEPLGGGRAGRGGGRGLCLPLAGGPRGGAGGVPAAAAAGGVQTQRLRTGSRTAMDWPRRRPTGWPSTSGFPASPRAPAGCCASGSCWCAAMPGRRMPKGAAPFSPDWASSGAVSGWSRCSPTSSRGWKAWLGSCWRPASRPCCWCRRGGCWVMYGVGQARISVCGALLCARRPCG